MPLVELLDSLNKSGIESDVVLCGFPAKRARRSNTSPSPSQKGCVDYFDIDLDCEGDCGDAACNCYGAEYDFEDYGDDCAGDCGGGDCGGDCGPWNFPNGM